MIIITDQLEADIEGTNDENGISQSSQGSEIITRLNEVLNKENFEGKSNLTHKNIMGIIRLIVMNEYIKWKYGFSVKMYDYIIEQKSMRVLSAGGMGRQQMIELVNAIKAEIRAGGSLDNLINPLFGGGGRSS